MEAYVAPQTTASREMTGRKGYGTQVSLIRSRFGIRNTDIVLRGFVCAIGQLRRLRSCCFLFARQEGGRLILLNKPRRSDTKSNSSPLEINVGRLQPETHFRELISRNLLVVTSSGRRAKNDKRIEETAVRTTERLIVREIYKEREREQLQTYG